MKFIDLAGTSRISKLMDLAQVFKTCRTPFDAVLVYCKYLKEAYVGRAHLVLSTKGLPKGQFRVWRFLDDQTMVAIHVRSV